MASNPYHCDNINTHAKAVESAVFQSLVNAQSDPSREHYWRTHADKLEQKFTTGHGKHYSYFLEPFHD